MAESTMFEDTSLVGNTSLITDSPMPYGMSNDISNTSSSVDLSSTEITRTLGHKGNVTYTYTGDKRDLGGTVVCGVCGAVRYYSFVKQAKKFGVYSCESCRKFISKMIHNKGGGKLKCIGDKGKCKVPPYILNPVDSVRYSYSKGKKVRCPACWLKMCLNTFSMPGNLCAFLGNMLPDFMQDPAFMTSAIPDEINLKKKKRNSSQEQNISNVSREYEDIDELEPKGRQKRKAAKKFMENISRITGRVSDDLVDHKFSQSESTKKRAEGNGTDVSWRVVKKDKNKVQIAKKKRARDHIELKTEYVDEDDKQESTGSESPSVQDVIRKVGRPRLIILTRNVELDSENGGVKIEKIDENGDANEEIEEDPFYNWHVIG